MLQPLRALYLALFSLPPEFGFFARSSVLCCQFRWDELRIRLIFFLNRVMRYTKPMKETR